MRILHILGDRKLPRDPTAEGSSGIVRAVLEIARAQATLGHQVTVAAIARTSWKGDWEGVHLRRLPVLPWAQLAIVGKRIDFRHHLPFVWLTRSQPFDVVHGHSYGYLRFLRAQVRVAHFHGDPFFRGGADERLDLSPTDLAVIRRATDVQLTVNACFAREIEQRLNGGAHVRVIYNAVDTSRFCSNERPVEALGLRQKWGVGKADVVFLFAGAVVPDKGVIHLAHAFAHVATRAPFAHLVLAGTSDLWGGSADRQPHSPSYEDQVVQTLRPAINAGQVHLLGKVGYADMPAAYAASDALILPSIVREGCPLVVLESMAAGRAVIASNVGGIPEIVDAQTGILVPPGDEERLADAMWSLLNDRDRLAKLGAYASQKAKAYSWDAVAKQLDSIYLGVYQRKAE